jgi:hypothetical protein
MVKHSVLMYDLPEILRQLGLNLREFRQILVLSGTDYNKDESASLFDVLKWFDAYKADTLMMEEDVAFYEWVKGIQPEQARKIYKMFVLTDKTLVTQSANYEGTIKNRDIERGQLIKVLAKDGFLFV